jgi:hypothetical protein
MTEQEKAQNELNRVSIEYMKTIEEIMDHVFDFPNEVEEWFELNSKLIMKRMAFQRAVAEVKRTKRLMKPRLIK